MALLLNIDTSSPKAMVFLSEDATLIAREVNEVQKDHASFLEPAIQQLFSSTGKTLAQLSAIAVVSGPGSYTGLRVGLSTAKGLCYALNKPLIFTNALYLLAMAAKKAYTPSAQQMSAPLYCPMIDARRMEVFTALYDNELTPVQPPAALILDEQSFQPQLTQHTVVFSGSGSEKFKSVCQSPNAVFSPAEYTPNDMAECVYHLFIKNEFVNLAYSEPFYLKEFFTNFKKN